MINENRPLGQLSYVERIQMDEIVKLKTVIKNLMEIIRLYQTENETLKDFCTIERTKND